mmetsp:Transcript_6850/g.12336  ORF Transcript_6850/g.12336 Transcript_6850/m.12336 type:complete len:233 (+) Transcript_6850:163-861(+)
MYFYIIISLKATIDAPVLRPQNPLPLSTSDSPHGQVQIQIVVADKLERVSGAVRRPEQVHVVAHGEDEVPVILVRPQVRCHHQNARPASFELFNYLQVLRGGQVEHEVPAEDQIALVHAWQLILCQVKLPEFHTLFSSVFFLVPLNYVSNHVHSEILDSRLLQKRQQRAHPVHVSTWHIHDPLDPPVQNQLGNELPHVIRLVEITSWPGVGTHVSLGAPHLIPVNLGEVRVI